MAEQRGETARDPYRIADAARLGEQRLGRAGSGQRRAQPVHDGAALGLQHDRPRVLALGQGGQVTVANDLQPAEAADDAGEGKRQDAGENEDPWPQAVHVRAPALVT